MPKEPMLFYPYNYCLNCKTNSIELYSWHNYGQHYSKLLDQYRLTGKVPPGLNKYGIFTMRCSNCGKEYKIVWEDGFPRPMVDNFDMDNFMNSFKLNSILGKPQVITNIYNERLKDDNNG